MRCVLAFSVVGCGAPSAQLDAGDAGEPPVFEDDSGSIVEGTYPNVPGGNPLVPETAAYPFPSDFYLTEDATSSTGYRVDLPSEILPEGMATELFADMDGFSLIPSILAYLPGSVSADSLPDPLDPGTTLDVHDSPALLIHQGTLEPVPILIENDLTAASDDERALILRPLVALEPDTSYAVILRDQFTRPDGTRHEASAAFAALRDGIPTDVPEIERQRESYAAVAATMSALGIDASHVVLAWRFHTRSDAQLTGDLLTMQDLANEAPLGDYTITRSRTVEVEGRTYQYVDATFQAPNFVGDDGLIYRDEMGAVAQNGTREITFGLSIPRTVVEPRPTIFWGHGFNGDWGQSRTGPAIATAYDARFNVIATNIGLNVDNKQFLIDAVLGDAEQVPRLVADVWQNLVNHTVLSRLLKERLSSELDLDWGDGSFHPIDSEAVHYAGGSNGSTFGYVLAATSPQFTRAALVVGGGGLMHFLERAVQWNEFGPTVNLLHPDALKRQLLFNLFQLQFDSIDAMSYAKHLVYDRYPGRPPLRAAVIMAVNDCQVRNLVTEWVVRTAQIPLVTPSAKDVFGLETVPASSLSAATSPGAFFVYDEGFADTPLTNLPPAEDNGTHATVGLLPAVQAQLATFLLEGAFAQYCDGPCDPE